MEASIRIAAASSMGPELEEECQGSSLCSARGNFIPAAGWGVEVGNRFNQVYQSLLFKKVEYMKANNPVFKWLYELLLWTNTCQNKRGEVCLDSLFPSILVGRIWQSGFIQGGREPVVETPLTATDQRFRAS